MSTKTNHTPGPICIQGNGTLLHPVTNRPLTTIRFETTLGTFEVLDETNEPEGNAARLVACWNACESLDRPETQIPALKKLATECVALRRQRAELLTVAKDFLYVAENLPELSGFTGKRCDMNEDLCGAAQCDNCGCINNKIHDARTALAKATEGGR